MHNFSPNLVDIAVTGESFIKILSSIALGFAWQFIRSYEDRQSLNPLKTEDPCNPMLIDMTGTMSYNPALIIMNLPNLLTILRILLVPVFINLLIYRLYPSALGVFLLASFTDSLDGIIARAANQRTALGTYLDPMADKLLLTAAFVTLSVLQFIPVWVSVIVVSRDIILVLGALVLHLAQAQFIVVPTPLGKATTFFQVVYVILILSLVVMDRHSNLEQPFVFGMLLLTIISGLHYIYRGIRPLNNHVRS